MNGWKWSALNTGSATAMNIASASSLMTTRMALSVRALAGSGDQQAGDDADDEDRPAS